MKPTTNITIAGTLRGDLNKKKKIAKHHERHRAKIEETYETRNLQCLWNLKIH